MSLKYIRNVEDIENIIMHAKLQNVQPKVQPIYVADHLKKYKILELNDDILNDLQSGESLTFKGDKEEKVVLCSKNATYDVKEAETSNSLLVIPKLKTSNEFTSSTNIEIEHKNIVGVFHTYFEVKKCKPLFGKLRNILEESAYRGLEMESELAETANMYSMYDLLVKIQASEMELREALLDIGAFEIDGKWRIMEFNYHFRVLSYILNLVDEQSWKHDELQVSLIFELMSDLIPEPILKHLLSTYTQENEMDESRVILVNEKVCRFLGESLLRSMGQFRLKEFLQAWQDTVPEGLVTDIRQLEGLVYTDIQSNECVIHYLPEYSLPVDIVERLQHLFRLKDKWKLEEIQPFIQPLSNDNVNLILTKYARSSKQNGVKYYHSKHGK